VEKFNEKDEFWRFERRFWQFEARFCFFEIDFGVCEFLTKIFKFPAVNVFVIPKEVLTTFFKKLCVPKKKIWNKIGGPNFDRHLVRTHFSSRKRPQGSKMLEISISNLF